MYNVGHNGQYMYMIKAKIFEKDKAKQYKPNPKAVLFQRKIAALYMQVFMVKSS